jgi:hypothetical protein
VKWVWENSGNYVAGLNRDAGSFYVYGQVNGTLSNTPHLGDAVVFDYQGGGHADHVAIVTGIDYGNGNKIQTVSGNWRGLPGTEALYASTAKVIVNSPNYNPTVGSPSLVMAFKTISGYVSPAAPPREALQAFVYPNQQHFLSNDGNGNLRHHWYDGSAGSVMSNTWATGISGQPVALVDGTSQHIFARDPGGALQHWFWDPVNGAAHDTWAPSGLADDPAAMMVGDFQDLWAVDNSGSLQHWFWGPQTTGVQNDTWGSGVVGRPSALLTPSGEQHVFARGTEGTLEHFWCSPSVSGYSHDTWGSGLASDPAALAIGDYQDVWAVDNAGNLQQWYWGPNTGGVQHFGANDRGPRGAYIGRTHPLSGHLGRQSHWG